MRRDASSTVSISPCPSSVPIAVRVTSPPARGSQAIEEGLYRAAKPPHMRRCVCGSADERLHAAEGQEGPRPQGEIASQCHPTRSCLWLDSRAPVPTVCSPEAAALGFLGRDKEVPACVVHHLDRGSWPVSQCSLPRRRCCWFRLNKRSPRPSPSAPQAGSRSRLAPARPPCRSTTPPPAPLAKWW